MIYNFKKKIFLNMDSELISNAKFFNDFLSLNSDDSEDSEETRFFEPDPDESSSEESDEDIRSLLTLSDILNKQMASSSDPIVDDAPISASSNMRLVSPLDILSTPAVP